LPRTIPRHCNFKASRACAKTKRNETKRTEKNLCSEEDVLGETTTRARATDPAITDRLVEKVGARNGRDRLLSDDEIAELGTLPLDELHRLRERGEL